MNISELMKDKAYVANLLNGPCVPRDETQDCAPLNPDWIDEETSTVATEAFHRLLPDGIPYLTWNGRVRSHAALFSEPREREKVRGVEEEKGG